MALQGGLVMTVVKKANKWHTSYVSGTVQLTDACWCTHSLKNGAAKGGTALANYVYYESIKREVKRRLIYDYRCDERRKTKTEESTRLTDIGLVVELEHLKTKTRLIDKKFASVRGGCEI